MTKAVPTPRTLVELCQAAMQIGARREAFSRSWRARSLSRDGWMSAALQLAGVETLEELEGIRTRVTVLPHLHALVQSVARTAALTSISGEPVGDCPSIDRSFGMGDSHAGAFAERLTAGITAEQASAVAALIAAERGRPWGDRASIAERDRLAASFAAELAELQAEIDRLDGPRWVDLDTDGAALFVAGSDRRVRLEVPPSRLAWAAADAGALAA